MESNIEYIKLFMEFESIAKKKHEEMGDYSNKVITVAFPYDSFDGLAAATLAKVQEAYIARLDRENIYKLPHGNLSVMLMKIDKDISIRMMPDKRYYGEYAVVRLMWKYEFRTFDIILRNGKYHDVPSRIEFYSRGLPATNEPSKQPPIAVYLTKIE